MTQLVLEGAEPPPPACDWCSKPIEQTKRKDSRYCSKPCRQSAWRFGRNRPHRESTSNKMRFAYADPPYPGQAGLYRDHPDFGGEVDHRELIDRMHSEFTDGWAVSTSSTSLQAVLALAPQGCQVGAWHRGERPTPSWSALDAWEPVIYWGGRRWLTPVEQRRTNSLVFTSRPRTSDPRRVIGAKPSEFAWWLFGLLGALPGDDLVDLFPGSGGIARAWELYADPSLLER